MDGLFFYWMIWIAWIIVMFFVPNTVFYRYQLLCHLLIVIILSGYELSIYHFQLGLSGIYLFIILLIYNRKLSLLQGGYFTIRSWTIGIGYAAFQLFMMLDPIIMIVEASWMQAVAINYTVLLLFKNWKQRVSAMIIGMVLGDCLFASLLVAHSLPYKAVSLEWLDTTALSVGVGLVWIAAERVSKLFYQQTQARLNS